MLEEIFKFIGVLTALCVTILLVVLAVTLPFAFIGWVLLSGFGLFFVVPVVTYGNSLVLGLLIVVVLAVIVTFVDAVR